MTKSLHTFTGSYKLKAKTSPYKSVRNAQFEKDLHVADLSVHAALACLK